MNIELQKRTTKVLLHDLTEWAMKPGVVAGGAVRDWQMGCLADDIDIYIDSDKRFTNARFKYELNSMLLRKGYDVVGAITQMGFTGSDERGCGYYDTKGIIAVYEFYLEVRPFDFQRIQVIRMESDSETVFQRFPVSTSKVAMLRDGTVMMSEDFVNSLDQEIVYYHPSVSDYYLGKMVKKLSPRGYAFAEFGMKP